MFLLNEALFPKSRWEKLIIDLSNNEVVHLKHQSLQIRVTFIVPQHNISSLCHYVSRIVVNNIKEKIINSADMQPAEVLR